MLCGLAPTVPFLVGARILQAAAAAALVPSSLALVLQTFPRHKIPVAVAIWGAVGAVAGAAGPTLGGLVIENLGWRWAFYINLPVGIVSFVLGRRVLPEWREPNPGRLPDAASVGLLTVGRLFGYGGPRGAHVWLSFVIPAPAATAAGRRTVAFNRDGRPCVPRGRPGSVRDL